MKYRIYGKKRGDNTEHRSYVVILARNSPFGVLPIVARRFTASRPNRFARKLAPRLRPNNAYAISDVGQSVKKLSVSMSL